MRIKTDLISQYVWLLNTIYEAGDNDTMLEVKMYHFAFLPKSGFDLCDEYFSATIKFNSVHGQIPYY